MAIMVCWIVTLLGTPSARALEVDPRPSLAGASEYVYKRASGADLRIWVFRDSASRDGTRRPAVLFFGGGGWIGQNPAQFSPQARYLAGKGLVAMVADYRVQGKDGTTPYEAVMDAKSAIRWVRLNSAKLGIDPGRLAIGGGSAGGHLALAAALVDGFDEPAEDRSVSCKPDALILFNPVPNTVQGRGIPLTPEQQMFIDLLGPRAQEISPIHHLVDHLPPTIIFHGEADALVPFGEVEGFCRKAVALGNECEVVGFPGAGHGFFNPRAGRTWFLETLAATERFLERIGYIR
jgi:acetyl esterase/lipase